MRERRIRPRLIAVLLFLVVTAAAAWSFSPSQASASLTPMVGNGCTYASQDYSYHACRGGQRCQLGPNDFYYWEDDSGCPQSSPGPRGLPQV